MWWSAQENFPKGPLLLTHLRIPLFIYLRCYLSVDLKTISFDRNTDPWRLYPAPWTPLSDLPRRTFQSPQLHHRCPTNSYHPLITGDTQQISCHLYRTHALSINYGILSCAKVHRHFSPSSSSSLHWPVAKWHAILSSTHVSFCSVFTTHTHHSRHLNREKLFFSMEIVTNAGRESHPSAFNIDIRYKKFTSLSGGAGKRKRERGCTSRRTHSNW